MLRAVGSYRGKSEISSGQIKCDLPTVTAAIPDVSFSMGLWNTYGANTLFFPDQNNSFADPCGGWLLVENNLADLGLSIDRILVRFRIPGFRATWTRVPMRHAFPTACRGLRRGDVPDPVERLT